mmetsp:Transcript_41775/g.104993  ORF Transcript_41775/g.104993 Transcript_41775/m.104993 type:complete len:215 (-) Transcript_41775:209-853(-)
MIDQRLAAVELDDGAVAALTSSLCPPPDLVGRHPLYPALDEPRDYTQSLMVRGIGARIPEFSWHSSGTKLLIPQITKPIPNKMAAPLRGSCSQDLGCHPGQQQLEQAQQVAETPARRRGQQHWSQQELRDQPSVGIGGESPSTRGYSQLGHHWHRSLPMLLLHEPRQRVWTGWMQRPVSPPGLQPLPRHALRRPVTPGQRPPPLLALRLPSPPV